MVPNQFSPIGQMFPNNLVPMDKWSPTNLVSWTNGPKIFLLSRGTGCVVPEIRDQIDWGPFVQGDQICGDHLSMGNKFVGTICPWGPNLMGTVCPGGPNWLGTICPWGPNFWGPFVHGDRKWGTGSPGIKWVRDQLSRSLQGRTLYKGGHYLRKYGMSISLQYRVKNSRNS